MTHKACRSSEPLRPARLKRSWSTGWMVQIEVSHHERAGGPHGAGPRLKADGRIVIVGDSLAGLRAAETLREEGFAGRLTIVGDRHTTL